MNIDVVSFERLAFRVMEEVGEDMGQVLESSTEEKERTEGIKGADKKARIHCPAEINRFGVYPVSCGTGGYGAYAAGGGRKTPALL